MQYIGVDLGSTNLKAAIYNTEFYCIASRSRPVLYDRSDGVELDIDTYWGSFVSLIKELIGMPGVKKKEVCSIAFTGQGETLLILDRDGRPLMNGISWMDERSKEECKELAGKFTPEECESVTGQLAVLPTWPATKILWLKKHRPELFAQAGTYMLLKDYFIYRLTGKKMADCSIATFSFYFDIYKKCYWKKMLDAVGICEEQLPPLTEPCTEAGMLTGEAAEEIGLTPKTIVNVGTLDHFAGMIGTGNVELGGISLSTGTVMALAALAKKPKPGKRYGIAMHYGFLPDTYVMLPVAESGGVSLEWFKQVCMPGVDYDHLNETLEGRKLPGRALFLPYLVGVNAPEFEADASGLFYGLRSDQDAFDMAAAVMEGVAYLLRKNCEAIRRTGTPMTHIIATGGGAKSRLWCQMQADITGLPILVPREKEAACLGAVAAAAKTRGEYSSYKEMSSRVNGMQQRYEPQENSLYERKYRQFCLLYEAMVATAKID